MAPDPKQLATEIIERCSSLGFAAAGVCGVEPTRWRDEQVADLPEVVRPVLDPRNRADVVAAADEDQRGEVAEAVLSLQDLAIPEGIRNDTRP